MVVDNDTTQEHRCKQMRQIVSIDKVMKDVLVILDGQLHLHDWFTAIAKARRQTPRLFSFFLLRMLPLPSSYSSVVHLHVTCKEKAVLTETFPLFNVPFFSLTLHWRNGHDLICPTRKDDLDHPNIPFLPPWKNILTTKTCRPAMETIMALSSREKLKMRLSVLRTVLKLRFSRVRKYFCWRVTVLS